MSDPVDAPQERRISRSRLIGWFVATTLLSGGVSLLSIPLIVTFTDSVAWGSVALGQAIGSSAGVLAMFGWGVTGPATVAMMSPSQRPAAYWNSVAARGLLFLPSVALTGVATWYLVPSEQIAATACAVAMAFGGLSGSWYAVGRRRPDILFLLDTVPRVAGTIAGLTCLWAGLSLTSFGVAQLCGSLLAFVLVSLWAVPGLRRPVGAVHNLRAVAGVIAGQRHGVAVAVAVASYYPVVLGIVAAYAPASLPLYALIDKVLRFATMAMQPVYQYFQATVPTHRGAALARAIRRSLIFTTVIGVVSGLGFALLLPLAAGILSAGQIEVPVLVAINLGIYMTGIVVMTYMATVALIAVSRERLIGRGPLIGTAVGLIVTLFLAIYASGDAISFAFVITAVLIITYQFVILLRVPRSGDGDRDTESEAAHVT